MTTFTLEQIAAQTAEKLHPYRSLDPRHCHDISGAVEYNKEIDDDREETAAIILTALQTATAQHAPTTQGGDMQHILEIHERANNLTAAQARRLQELRHAPQPDLASVRDFIEGVIASYEISDDKTLEDATRTIMDHLTPLLGANKDRERLDWHEGPARGGEGTAGKDDKGVPQWWDGDRLLIIVENSSGDDEMAIVDISADEELFLVKDASTGDTYDAWGPESWSWWAKFTEKHLPARHSAPKEGGAG